MRINKPKMIIFTGISFILITGILSATAYVYIRYLNKDIVPPSFSSKNLTSKTYEYMQHAMIKGIEPCANDVSFLNHQELMKIYDNDFYIIDNRMNIAKPYLTKEAIALLDTIGVRFHAKISNTKYKHAKFIITSATRSKEAQMKLMKHNINAINNSPHLYGVAFDVSYVRFYHYPGIVIRSQFLKEALAEVLLELKSESKCWALTEVKQSCFHVVVR